MNIIEKIEIKYFRSFADKKVEILGLRDVNIFSGCNDSGKSNILRALNLFFNNEVSRGVKFNLEKDFSKITEKIFDVNFTKTKRKRKSDKFVSIKVYFLNPEHARKLPEKFWVSKKYTNTILSGEKDYQKEIQNKANQVSHFLNSIHFQYVPAIKDDEFYNFLIDEYQKSLNPETRKLVQDLDKKIKEESTKLFEEFQKHTPEITHANFQIPEFKIDFAKTLKVQTENEIELKSRGDGIQAKFLPPLLNEISKNKKIVVWGFEEPENSLEYKNARDLANMFLDVYSDKKQIFITTHSKEFLRLRDKKKVSVYRVLKDKTNGGSKIILHQDSETEEERKEYAQKQLVLFPEEISKIQKESILDKIFQDLGMIEESKLVYDLEQELRIKPTEIKAKIQSIIRESNNNTTTIQNLNVVISRLTKPLLVVEDKYDQIYKIAWMKLHDVEYDNNETDINKKFEDNADFLIWGAESAGDVFGFLRVNNTQLYQDKKIIGLFDFDKEGSDKFYHLKKKDVMWNRPIQGDLKTGFFRKREIHPCFYALLLPVPDRLKHLISNVEDGNFTSYIEIENLLPESFLENNKFCDKKPVLTLTYLKIKTEKKDKLWKKLKILSKSDFADFEPLFLKIKTLFA